MWRELILLLLLFAASYVFVETLRRFVDVLKIHRVRKRALAYTKSFFLYAIVAVAFGSAYYLTF